MTTYTAEQELAMTLKCLRAPNDHTRNELAEKFFAHRDLPVSLDGKIMQKHELIRSETLDGAALLRPDLLRTINEGCQPALRNLSELYFTFNTQNNQVKIPKGTTGSYGSYAEIIDEGSAATVDNNRVGNAVINIIKTMSTVEITREMEQDAEFDLIAREVSAAGARLGNTMHSIALAELQTNAAVESTQTVTDKATLKSAINVELATIQENGYVPDIIQLTPMAGAWLRDELSLGHYPGTDARHLAEVSAMFGVKCVVNPISPATITAGKYTPGAGTFGGDNHVGAIIYVKDKAVAVATRDPIGTETPFKDIYKDLTAITASARFGAAAIHTNTTNDKAAAVYISA